MRPSASLQLIGDELTQLGKKKYIYMADIDSFIFYLFFWLMIAFIWRYSPLSRADSLRSHVVLHEWLAFYSVFLNIHRGGVLTTLARLVPHETAAVSAQVLCTPYNHASCHFMQSHIRPNFATTPSLFSDTGLLGTFQETPRWLQFSE